MVHRQSLPRHKVPRHKVPETKRPKTKCPKGQNIPKDKTSQGQNVLHRDFKNLENWAHMLGNGPHPCNQFMIGVFLFWGG